jgi:hypothetical protein
MKTICIQEWYGRLGNNIIQVKNALHIALYYGYNNVTIPHHPFFKTRNIIVDLSDNNEDKILYSNESACNFYFSNDITIIEDNVTCFSENHAKIRDILRVLFIIDYEALTPLDDDILVIHIRSGDVFQIPNWINPEYIAPPLSYYENVINVYSRIIIIAEDMINPIIMYLRNKYSNKIININLHSTLEDDIEYILRARNIMMSMGSFIPTLLWMTKYTRVLIHPSFDPFVKHIIKLTDINSEFKLTSVDLTPYYDEVRMSVDETLETRIQRIMIR